MNSHSDYNAVYYTGLFGKVHDGVNGSSHKYTGGQLRDQSLFKNGTMCGETESLYLDCTRG